MPSEPVQRFLDKIGDFKQTGNSYTACCPAHDDNNPSLSIGEGDDGRVLLTCHSQGCTAESICRALKLELSDLFCKSNGHTSTATLATLPKAIPPAKQVIEATYSYRDAIGNLIFEVVRYKPKKFRQRRSKNVWHLRDIDVRPLYRLPQLLAAGPESFVYICEGEKDCDKLAAQGLVATTNSGGASKLSKTDWTPLDNRNVVIIPDNDKAGRKHADDLARKLNGNAESLRILTLLDLDHKGDVSDWLDAGNDAEDLQRLAENTPLYETSADLSTQGTNAMKSADNKDADNTKTYNPTDSGMAQRLVDKNIGAILYVPAWGKWLIWNGRNWQVDDALKINGMITKVTDDMLKDAISLPANDSTKKELANLALKYEQRRSHEAVIAMARSMVPIRPTQLDQDQWLFNCENGTIDLRTGSLQEHNPSDWLTHTAPVKFDPNVQCPKWLEFLNQIMGNDAELVNYLQQLTGYFLTGNINDQIFPVFHGVGANGKSVFIDTIMEMMGDYASTASDSLITCSRREHPTEIADLLGKRLVVASETESGEKLRVAFVKKMTGDKFLKGRYMHKDLFEFERTHKTLLVTNHRPVITESGNAIWRRVKLIPFNTVIPVEEQDPRLGDKLRKEWPGILAWAVRGCVSWQEQGFKVPEAVKVATSDYKAESDHVADFIADRCITLSVDNRISRDEIGSAYVEWCKLKSIKPLDMATFYARLLEEPDVEKLEKVKMTTGPRKRGFKGITLTHYPKTP